MAVGAVVAVAALGASLFGSSRARKAQRKAIEAAERRAAEAKIESYAQWLTNRKLETRRVLAEQALNKDAKNLAVQFERAASPAVAGAPVVVKQESTMSMATFVVPIIASIVIAKMLKV